MYLMTYWYGWFTFSTLLFVSYFPHLCIFSLFFPVFLFCFIVFHYFTRHPFHSFYFTHCSEQAKHSPSSRFCLYYSLCLLNFPPRYSYNSLPHFLSAPPWPWEAFIHHPYSLSLWPCLIFLLAHFTTWHYIYTCLLVFFLLRLECMLQK